MWQPSLWAFYVCLIHAPRFGHAPCDVMWQPQWVAKISQIPQSCLTLFLRNNMWSNNGIVSDTWIDRIDTWIDTYFLLAKQMKMPKAYPLGLLPLNC